MEWIKHGWGEDYSSIPNKSQSYYININDIVLSQDRSLYYAKIAIDRIKEKYPPPYYLAASGGIDSQAMILAWYLNNEDFRVVSFRYENGFNDHDIKNLKKFCQVYDIDYQQVEVTFLDLFDSEFPDWSIKYNCESPQMYVYTKFREYIIGGTLILSGGLYPGLELNYTLLGLERYRILNNSNYVPFFFLYTPELLGSFYQHSRKFTNIQEVSYIQVYEKLILLEEIQYRCKYLTYQDAGYSVIPQDKKYSGFEIYKDYYDQVLKIPNRVKAKYANFQSKRSFDLWYRYRIADKLTLPRQIVILRNGETINI